MICSGNLDLSVIAIPVQARFTKPGKIDELCKVQKHMLYLNRSVIRNIICIPVD